MGGYPAPGLNCLQSTATKVCNPAALVAKSANQAAVSPGTVRQVWSKRDQFGNPGGTASLRSPRLLQKQAMTAGAAWLYPGKSK